MTTNPTTMEPSKLHKTFKQRKSPDSVTDVAASTIHYPCPVLSTSGGQVTAVTSDSISITQLTNTTHQSICVNSSFSTPNFTYTLYCSNTGSVTQKTLSNLSSMPIVEEYQIEGISYTLITYNNTPPQTHRIPDGLIPFVNIGDSVSASSIIAGTPIVKTHITLFLLKLQSYFPSQRISHARHPSSTLISQLDKCLEILKAKELAFLIYADIFIHQFSQEKNRVENKILSILQSSTAGHSNTGAPLTSQHDFSNLKMNILRADDISPLIKIFFHNKTPSTLSHLANLIYSDTDLRSHINFYSSPLSTFYHNTHPFLEAFTLAIITAKWQTSDNECIIENDVISFVHSLFLSQQSDRDRILRRRRYHLAKHAYSELGSEPVTSQAPTRSKHEKKEFMFMLRHFMLKIKHLEAEKAFKEIATDYLSLTDLTKQSQSQLPHPQPTPSIRTNHSLSSKKAIDIAILLQPFQTFPSLDYNVPTEGTTKIRLEDLKDESVDTYSNDSYSNFSMKYNPSLFSSGLISPSPPRVNFDFPGMTPQDLTKNLNADCSHF